MRAPWHVWVLTAGFCLLVATWASMTPSLIAPDESAHLSSSYRMSEGFDWPDPGEARMPGAVVAAGSETSTPQDERSSFNELEAEHPADDPARGDQMTQHPFVYYAITGAVLDLPGVKELPWGQALFVLRLSGILFAAPLVWLSWNAVLVLTRSPRIAALAALMPFAVPQLAQNFGTLTNDSIAITLAWLVSWLGIRVWSGDRRPLVVLGLGAAFGAALLSKGTALPMGLFVVLVLLLGPGGGTWKRRVWTTFLPLGVAFVIGGWWWLRNIILFRTIQPDGMGPFVSFPTWPAGQGPDVGVYISEVWRVTVTSFWGWFGRVNAPLPEPLVATLTVLCVMVVVAGTFRHRSQLRTMLVLAAPVLAMVVLFVDTSWSAYAETTEPRGLHGRYFFTVLLLLIALAALASRNIIREWPARRAFAFVVTGAVALLVPTGLLVALLGLWGDFSFSSFTMALGRWIHASPLVSSLDLLLVAALGSTLAFGVVGTARAATARTARTAIVLREADAVEI